MLECVTWTQVEMLLPMHALQSEATHQCAQALLNRMCAGVRDVDLGGDAAANANSQSG